MEQIEWFISAVFFFFLATMSLHIGQNSHFLFLFVSKFSFASLPKIAGGRNRESPVGKKMPKGTVSGHYMRFIAKTLDEMDKFPETKGFYIVIDNAPTYS